MSTNKKGSGVSAWKKVVLIVIAIIFSLRIGYIAIRGEIDKEYVTSGKYDLSEAVSIPCVNVSQTFIALQDRINSIELFLGNVDSNDVDGSGIVIRIYSGDDLIYGTTISTIRSAKSFDWTKVFVNAPLKKGSEYRITLDTNEKCTHIPNILIVNNDCAPEILASYSGEEAIEGNFAINYGYLQFPSLFDRLVMISLWIILYLIIWISVHRIEKIIAFVKCLWSKMVSLCNRGVMICVWELIVALLIINCSQITFDGMTKVLLLAIAFLSSVVYTKKGKRCS